MTRETLQFSGKTVLITGGTEGVGYATALLVLTRGAKVAITGRSADKGEAALTRLRAACAEGSTEVEFFPHDAASRESWDQVIAQVESAFGGLHVLVNNAGLHIAKPFLDTSADDVDAVFGVNVMGVIAGIQAAVPLMRKTIGDDGDGAIVNVSSNAAFKPAPNESIYSASKGALQLLTRSLANEFGAAGYRIRINAVNPSIIETPMLARGLAELVAEGVYPSEAAARADLLKDYPLGRFASPEDVAKAILFFASSEAEYLTGAMLAVDGGDTA